MTTDRFSLFHLLEHIARHYGIGTTWSPVEQSRSTGMACTSRASGLSPRSLDRLVVESLRCAVDAGWCSPDHRRRPCRVWSACILAARLTERRDAGAIERPERDSIDEATAHLLWATWVAVLTAPFLVIAAETKGDGFQTGWRHGFPGWSLG